LGLRTESPVPARRDCYYKVFATDQGAGFQAIIEATVDAMRAISFLLSGLALSACILPGGQRVEPIPGTVGVVVKSPNMPNRGFTRKRVITKQEPDLLIAEDATSCRVSEARYREVEVGDEELCGWQ
jgi:hypothetical protein